jgi:hypothetical protein
VAATGDQTLTLICELCSANRGGCHRLWLARWALHLSRTTMPCYSLYDVHCAIARVICGILRASQSLAIPSSPHTMLSTPAASAGCFAPAQRLKVRSQARCQVSYALQVHTENARWPPPLHRSQQTLMYLSMQARLTTAAASSQTCSSAAAQQSSSDAACSSQLVLQPRRAALAAAAATLAAPWLLSGAALAVSAAWIIWSE